jgi:hypothetical protein
MSPPGPKSPPPSSPPPAFPLTPQDALEFMQRMWNPLGVPIPGFTVPAPAMAGQPAAAPFLNPAAMFATLDPAEFERKIGEMRVIEGWLTMSLNLMQMSIKTMELQKASLEALRAAHAPAPARAAAPPPRAKP